MKPLKKIDDPELDNLWKEFWEAMHRAPNDPPSLDDLISNYMEQLFKSGNYEIEEIFTLVTQKFGIEKSNHFETIKMLYGAYLFRFHNDIDDFEVLTEKFNKYKLK